MKKPKLEHPGVIKAYEIYKQYSSLSEEKKDASEKTADFEKQLKTPGIYDEAFEELFEPLV